MGEFVGTLFATDESGGKTVTKTWKYEVKAVPTFGADPALAAALAKGGCFFWLNIYPINDVNGFKNKVGIYID